jgi:hypothetical protein
LWRSFKAFFVYIALQWLFSVSFSESDDATITATSIQAHGMLERAEMKIG